MRVSRFAPLIALLTIVLTSCGEGRPVIKINSSVLRPPKFDAEFRRLWDDGSAEVSDYQTKRLRNGVLRNGSATGIVRRVTFSEDERVPVERTATRQQQGDLFAAVEMNWLERYMEGPQDCSEMTTSALALAAVDGRAAGTETKTDYSFQGWDGQLFHQLLFDATGIRSHQYSYYMSEGDEQITLTYPGDGVSGDALWFWARHMAAPALNPGEHASVLLLPTLSTARSQHIQLAWKRATLERSQMPTVFAGRHVETFEVRWDDGLTATFSVESALPYRVLHWENSSGESADFIKGSRMRSLDITPHRQ